MIFRIAKVLIIFLFLLVYANDVYAYLDPGTGSYAFQIVIAALIGGMFAIKLFWNKIKIFLKKLFSQRKRT